MTRHAALCQPRACENVKQLKVDSGNTRGFTAAGDLTNTNTALLFLLTRGLALAAQSSSSNLEEIGLAVGLARAPANSFSRWSDCVKRFNRDREFTEVGMESTEPHVSAGRQPSVLSLPPTLRMTGEQFWELCQLNRDWRLERTARGDIIVMPPTGALTGKRNARLCGQVSDWAERDGSGVTFDSSTGFELPNGAVRSPDVAWVTRARLTGLGPEDVEHFLPLCPDFVIELRSPSDKLSVLQEKMEEYIANGCRLGWLIDPATRCVYIYQPGQAAQRLEDPAEISGDPVLPGLLIELTSIWRSTL